MKIEEIQKVLHLGEGQNIEFKSHCQDTTAIGPVVSGLLNNSAGGFIVCGVDDTGKIIGIENAPVMAKKLDQELEHNLSPKTLVEIGVQNIHGKDLIVLEVPSGRDPPYAFQNIFYSRIGVTTRKADVETIREIILRRQEEPERWERRFSSIDPDKDLDLREIDSAKMSINKVGRLIISESDDPVTVLGKLSVFKYGRLTNGGDVLFSTNPAMRHPQIRVRIVSFTSDRSDDKYRILKSFEGPLVPLLEEVFGFIQRNTVTSSDFTTDPLKRKDESQYPPLAIREGLVNAFAHRDYSNYSGHITVNIYPDRLEIQNSGRFPEGVTPDALSKGHISVLRNPDIAHVLYLREFMEKIGRGSVLIQQSCIDRGLPLPQWFDNPQGVTLTFFASLKTQEITNAVNVEMNQDISQEVKRLLNALKGDMSRRELQKILKLKNDEYFRSAYLKIAIDQKFITMTIPEKPSSGKQKYRLTKKGESLRYQK